MAKDANDSVTLELIPAAKKRGRPASANALTNAERQRRFRESKKGRVQIDLSCDDWSRLAAILQSRYESDSGNEFQVVYAHIVEQVYRSGVKHFGMPAWFEEKRYKEPVTVTENQPAQEGVTVTEIEPIEDKPVTVTKKPRAKKSLAEVPAQAEESVTVTENPIPATVVTVTKNTYPVRYSSPHHPAFTWSGKGQRPKWVQDWLDGGGQLADLEVSAT